MFLAAVLQGTQFSAPVKIRNISTAGALVEAAAVPPAGTAARLVRGALAVPAKIVWSTQGRCGLQFSSLVLVEEWIALPANREQARVDEAVRLLKAGAIPLGSAAEASKSIDDTQLSTDVRTIASLLEALGEDLATNEVTVSAHSEQLQSLDLAIQSLIEVANALSRDADELYLSSRLVNLRASCREALARGQ